VLRACGLEATRRRAHVVWALAARNPRGRPHVALLEVAKVAAKHDRLEQRLPEVGRGYRDARKHQQHRAKAAVVHRRATRPRGRRELSDHERELSVDGWPLQRLSTPPGIWLKRNEAAPAADTASTGSSSGDTRLVFCAALRPLPTFGGQPLRGLSTIPDGERIASNLATIRGQCQEG